MPINFYLELLEGEACHIIGGASTHIGEVKYVQFIPQLAKPLLIKWLCEYAGKLIFSAHTLNANIPFLLVITNEVMADIYMLCSCMWNRVVGDLHDTLIVTQQWHLFELDSKVIQGSLLKALSWFW